MIRLQEINFKYKNEETSNLININLNIKKGECILICGGSGCGKTTLLRLINKLVPTLYEGELKGSVFLDNEDIEKIPMYALSDRVGSVFQNPKTQFFNVDTDSEIVFGLENKGMSLQEMQNRLEKTCNDLKINNLLHKSIFKISGGEKQKIAFASVYAINPDIYILDEPSSNLDYESIVELKQYLSLLKKQGKTIIVAEHRLFYLMDLIDRSIYLKNGLIEKIYSKEEFVNLSDDVRKEMGLRSIKGTNRLLQQKEKLQINNKKILKLNNLSIYRGNRKIISNLNFEASMGDIIGLIAPNGTGKTSLLRTISGLFNSYKGDITWNDKKFEAKNRIRNSYMVMQDVNYQLFSESVKSELKLGNPSIDCERIQKILLQLNLEQYADKHPNLLSGGQKQRLAIGVGIANNKLLFLLDEPTSGLDLENMLRVTELIKQVSRDRVTIIATHDMEFANLVCNKFIVLKKEGINEKFI